MTGTVDRGRRSCLGLLPRSLRSGGDDRRGRGPLSLLMGPYGTLLIARRRDSGLWELPGARVRLGEGAADAAVRATAEKAGVTVRITGLVGLTRPRWCARSTGRSDSSSPWSFGLRPSAANRAATGSRRTKPLGWSPHSSPSWQSSRQPATGSSTPCRLRNRGSGGTGHATPAGPMDPAARARSMACCPRLSRAALLRRKSGAVDVTISCPDRCRWA